MSKDHRGSRLGKDERWGDSEEMRGQAGERRDEMVGHGMAESKAESKAEVKRSEVRNHEVREKR